MEKEYEKIDKHIDKDSAFKYPTGCNRELPREETMKAGCGLISKTRLLKCENRKSERLLVGSYNPRKLTKYLGMKMRGIC